MHLSPDLYSAAVLDTGGAIPDFRGLEKGRSLISAYQSLAITPSTSGFEKLSTVLILYILKNLMKFLSICLNGSHQNRREREIVER